MTRKEFEKLRIFQTIRIDGYDAFVSDIHTETRVERQLLRQCLVIEVTYKRKQKVVKECLWIYTDYIDYGHNPGVLSRLSLPI